MSEESTIAPTTTGGAAHGDGSERAQRVLLGVPLVASMLIAIVRNMRHFSGEWSAHAEHHLVSDMVLEVGIAVIGLIILAGPLARGTRWAWWVLLVAGVSLYGGFWLGNATVGLGHDATVPNIAQSVLTGLYVLGLIAARRALPSPRRPPREEASSPTTVGASRH